MSLVAVKRTDPSYLSPCVILKKEPGENIGTVWIDEKREQLVIYAGEEGVMFLSPSEVNEFTSIVSDMAKRHFGGNPQP